MARCAGPRFLVPDELHTHRGRQGAVVALLARRVRTPARPLAPTLRDPPPDPLARRADRRLSCRTPLPRELPASVVR